MCLRTLRPSGSDNQLPNSLITVYFHIYLSPGLSQSIHLRFWSQPFPHASGSYSSSCTFTVVYLQMFLLFRLHAWSNLKSLTLSDPIWRLWSHKHILPLMENITENQHLIQLFSWFLNENILFNHKLRTFNRYRVHSFRPMIILIVKWQILDCTK